MTPYWTLVENKETGLVAGCCHKSFGRTATSRDNPRQNYDLFLFFFLVTLTNTATTVAIISSSHNETDRARGQWFYVFNNVVRRR